MVVFVTNLASLLACFLFDLQVFMAPCFAKPFLPVFAVTANLANFLIF